MSIIPNGNTAKITVPELLQRKSSAADSTKKKITCLTAYDYPTGRLWMKPAWTWCWWAIRWRWWCWATTARCR